MLFDKRTTSARAHRTTILINDPDWKFIKQRGFKATNLLRIKIRELQQRDDYGDVDFKIVADNFRKRFEKLRQKLEKLLTRKQFDAFMSE